METDDRSSDLKIDLRKFGVVLMLGILAVAAICSYALWKRLPNWWHGRVTAFEAYVVVAAIVSIWSCSRTWRIQLRTDNHGITVRNFLRTHRIGWSEVRRFTDGSVNLFNSRYWALGIVLRDGRVINATAASGGQENAYPSMLRAIQEMAQDYDIPVAFSGIVKQREWPDVGRYPDPGGKPGWLRDWDGKKWSLFITPEPTGRRTGDGKVLTKVWSLFPEAEMQWQDAVSRARRLRQYLRSTQLSPFYRADQAVSDLEAEKTPAELWSPLPGWEERWKEAASRARRAGIVLAIWLTAAAVALAGAGYLLLQRSSNHVELSFVAAVFGVVLLQFATDPWKKRKKFKQIDQMGRATFEVSDTRDNPVGPSGEQDEEPVRVRTTAVPVIYTEGVMSKRWGDSAKVPAGCSSLLQLLTAPSAWQRSSTSTAVRQARSEVGNGCGSQWL